MQYKNNKGFTIVETMIAVAIFTFIAGIATFVTIQLSKSYQQGVTRSKLDTAARNINYLFTEAVQYTTTPMTNPVSATGVNGLPGGGAWNVWCAGNYRFSWRLSSGANIYKDSLYEDQITDQNNCNSDSFSPTGSTTQLLTPPGSFISLFDIVNSANVWDLKMAIASGDINSFRSNSVTADPATATITLPICNQISISNFSFCGVVYYDNSVSSLVN